MHNFVDGENMAKWSIGLKSAPEDFSTANYEFWMSFLFLPKNLKIGFQFNVGKFEIHSRNLNHFWVDHNQKKQQLQ